MNINKSKKVLPWEAKDFGRTIRWFALHTVLIIVGFVGILFANADFNVDTTFHRNVYNDAGTVVFISDKRKKKSIKDLAIDKAKSFLMALKPRAFKFKDGTSGRYHHGFIAQEVKESMGGDDWGLYVENKDMDFIGLRYDEIIADLVKVVQDQEKRIQELERKMEK